jgi:diguanylate cyclase (GGDEF)-like protein
LRAQRFTVREASNVEAALTLQRERPQIALVLAHLRNPKDGLRLVSELREHNNADELAIVGLASQDSDPLTVQFLKAGASDFLVRPFEKEEYACRVYACLDRVAAMRRIKQLAFVDALTGCANRMAFFRQMPERLEDALQSKRKPAVALLSIDQLRRINELHGHSAGDVVLQHVAQSLTSQLGPSAFLARFSGEQFGAFVHDESGGAIGKLFERARATVERANISYEGKRMTVTVSCGAVACEADETLDTFVNRADEALEEAEDAGGNRVVLKA